MKTKNLRRSMSRKERYLKIILAGEPLASTDENLNLICFPKIGYSGRNPDWMAYVQWTLYEITKKKHHAEVAKRMVIGPRKRWRTGTSYHRDEEVMDEFCHYPYGYVYAGLRKKKMLTKDADESARKWLAQSLRFWQEYPSYFCGSTELDTGNLGITPACGADYAARYIYDGKFAKSLRAFAERTWTNYWRIGDEPEDAVNYEPIHTVFMPIWADIRREMKTLQNFVLHDTYNRVFQQILPMGAVCDHGDSGWQAGWAGSIATFEIAGAITGEGRYVWLAERMTDYLEQSGFLERFYGLLKIAHEGKPQLQGIPGLWAQDMFFLCQAYRWSNERIKPIEPKGWDSTITYRHRHALEAVWEETKNQSGCTASMTLYPHLRGERYEDKLILRSGYSRDSNHLVASLDKPAWHDHQDSGAIISWTHKGAVHLHASQYRQREAITHNLVYAADCTKKPEEELGTTYFYRARDYGKWNNRCMTTFIEDFSEIAMAGYRSVCFYNRFATWERTILFPRDGSFLVVIDEIENHGEDLWSAPLWHTEKLHALSDWWADCEHGNMPGGPDNFWTVAPKRLLIAFPLKENPLSQLWQKNADYEPRGTMTVADLERDWSQQNLIYQSGKVLKGGTVRFVSLLLPHDIDESPEVAASRIKIVTQDGNAWCLQITDKRGESSIIGMVPPRLPSFYSQPKADHVGFMPSWAKDKKVDVKDPHGDSSFWFTAGNIITDAELFYVKKSPEQIYIATRRMRNFEMGDFTHHSQISPCWPPTRFQVNAEFVLTEQKGLAKYSCRNFCPIDLSFGHIPKKIRATGGINGIPTAANVSDKCIHIELNALGEITTYLK